MTQSAWDSTPSVPQKSPQQTPQSAWDQTASPTQTTPKTSLLGSISQGAGNLLAGAVRGAGSIGATLVAPWDIASDALAGKGLSLQSNRERRQAMDDGLQMMGAEPDSWMYKGGKLAGEIAGTAGAGGVLANGARAAGAAPSLVSALSTGGMRAAGATGAVGMGVRTAGGAATGAASASLINPEDAGIGAVVGGVLPGAVKASGVISDKISAGTRALAEQLMQSAIKPTLKQLETGQAKSAVKTLLDYGISPNAAGVEKLGGMVDDLHQQVAGKIANSTATIDKQAVLDRVGDVRDAFKNQVSPQGDLASIQRVVDSFLQHPGAPLPATSMAVQLAQQLKQGTYNALSKNYGQLGGAETEAQKALARGLKEEISAAVPEVAGLNAEQSALVNALKVAQRRALMEQNKDPIGLAALASHPIGSAVYLMGKSGTKALAARLLNGSSTAAGASAPALAAALTNPLLRGAAVPAVVSGDR